MFLHAQTQYIITLLSLLKRFLSRIYTCLRIVREKIFLPNKLSVAQHTISPSLYSLENQNICSSTMFTHKQFLLESDLQHTSFQGGKETNSYTPICQRQIFGSEIVPELMTAIPQAPRNPHPPTATQILSAVTSERKKRNFKILPSQGPLAFRAAAENPRVSCPGQEQSFNLKSAHEPAWDSLPWPGVLKDAHGCSVWPPLHPTDAQTLTHQPLGRQEPFLGQSQAQIHRTRLTCKPQIDAHEMKAWVCKQPVFYSMNRTARNRVSEGEKTEIGKEKLSL